VQEFITQMIKTSIIVIVKDEPVISRTLIQLFGQIKNADTECIVVDASEGRLSWIRQNQPHAVWLDFQSKNPNKKISIAEQRNAGVNASNGNVIVFCDAGGSPTSSWLESITAPLLSGDQVLVGGPVLATNLSSLDIWTNLQHDGDEIQYPTTANLALARSAFDLVGGFNEDLDYGSDADLVWRLNDQGIKQICVAKAIMGLDGGSKNRELKRAWRYGKALADLLWLHPERRFRKAKSNPEIWIYPSLTIVGIFALLTIGFFKHLVIIFLTANLLLFSKNIKSSHPLQILARHYLYSWGICYQVLRRYVSRKGQSFQKSL
jgi:glycosyltransferase involved in cell wall biosynthesis